MILIGEISLFLLDICISNRRGPNTDPWGTPLQTRASLDGVQLTVTNCYLFGEKFV